MFKKMTEHQKEIVRARNPETLKRWEAEDREREAAQAIAKDEKADKAIAALPSFGIENGNEGKAKRKGKVNK